MAAQSRRPAFLRHDHFAGTQTFIERELVVRPRNRLTGHRVYGQTSGGNRLQNFILTSDGRFRSGAGETGQNRHESNISSHSSNAS